MPDYENVRKTLGEEQEKGSFIFLPSPIMDQSDSFYMPLIEIVRLRADEIYKAQGKYRIQYNGLLRLSQAAAFEWSAIDTCRTDKMADKMYISFRAVGGVKKADGKVYFHKAEKDLDLEVVEDELEEQYRNTWSKIGNDKKMQWKKNGHTSIETYVSGMVKRDLRQKRKNKLMLVESGAKARVIRFVLGLQGQYSDEAQLLNTRFVMVHYALNPNHPDVKKSLMQSLPYSMNMIYGSNRTEQISHTPSDPDVIDIQQQESIEPEFNIFDINDLESFEGLSPTDQSAWLVHYSKKNDIDWDSMTSDLKDGSVENANQVFRNGFFGLIQKKEQNK